MRGGRRHLTHSKIMVWVAIDRAARAIEELGVGGEQGRGMLPHLSALRERIHAEVCERGFNSRVGAFTQSYGTEALDASVLVIPHVGPRSAVVGTVAAKSTVGAVLSRRGDGQARCRGADTVVRSADPFQRAAGS